MKTKIFYLATFAFILSSLLSSCSLLKKEEFASRKYYNFPLSKHLMEGAEKEQVLVPSQKTVTEKITAKEETLSSEEITTASVDKKQVAGIYKENTQIRGESETRQKNIAESVTENKINNEPPVISLKRNDIFKIARKKITTSASGSDALLIVELLLAIILPPLGVFVHRGKAKKWFWITLALCILSGVFFGMTYAGYAGLFWGISAIIALCYVFGLMKD